MKLEELARCLPDGILKSTSGDLSVEIKSIAHDSRKVTGGGLFICLRGGLSDGRRFIPQAVSAGAVAAVCDIAPSEYEIPANLPVLHVVNDRLAMAHLASAFYGEPSRKLELTGITGTNGKTTVSFMIASILEADGRKTGIIGTTGVKIGGEEIETHWSVSTTPEANDLQQLFALMLERGASEAVMEVSSHAIDKERTAASAFDCVVFTNLTQDHLDYHKTMDAYRAVKQRLFDDYGRLYAKSPRYASINIDDPTGLIYAEAAKSAGYDVWTYGVHSSDAKVRAAQIEAHPGETKFQVIENGGETYSATLNMGGLFNVSNALAAIAAVRSRGISTGAVRKGLAALPHVPGRFESIPTGDKGFHVIVDYAHTPDGLENLLKSAKALNPRRIICVFGCGGDRDRTKRPLMGRLASEMADRVVITSDNPRTEDPEAIIKEIVAGIDPELIELKAIVDADRSEAIRTAILDEAKPGDLVLIAGKGHETYQIIGDRIFHFDDREKAKEAIALWK